MSKTLLLADDSVVIQKLVGLSFANEDVELTTTDNGDDAIARAKELKPDVVLADVVMPGKNGYEVCEALKADPELRHIPVLLLTGTFEAFDENRARSAGSDGHITKPFEAQALVDRVTELLAQAPPAPALATTAPNLDAPGVTRIAAAPADGDDAFEFFDDGAEQELGDAASPAAAPPAAQAAAPPPLPASPSPLDPPPQALDSPPQHAPDARPPSLDSPQALDSPPALERPASPAEPASSGTALPPLPSPAAPTATPGGPAAEAASLMPEQAPSTTPQIDDLAFDEEDLSPSVDPAATTVQMVDDSDELAETNADDLLLGDETEWNEDLQISSEPIRAGAVTAPPDDLFSDPPRPADAEAAAAASGPAGREAHVVSGGDRSSDAIAFGDDAQAAPDPMKTMLADDLFGDTPPPPPRDDVVSDLDLEVARAASEPPPAMSDDFDVSSSDLEQSIPAMPAFDATPEPPAASPAPPSPPPAPPAPAVEEPARATAPRDEDFSVSDGLLAGASAQSGDPAGPPPEAAVVQTEAASPGEALGPDLTPMMRERVHETLERVAWEAFADVSENIVKQVVAKVEQVAWEVIPQMAEAAIKEEIRRMKGETDE